MSIMFIGGFQKNTLIDFPGEIASLVFTQGCNFRCPYCHNPLLVPMATPGHKNQVLSKYPVLSQDRELSKEPVSSQDRELSKEPVSSQNRFLPKERCLHLEPVDEQEILSFLKKRRGLIDGVAITGGEPTLQEDIDDFCFKVKNLGFKVKLDTNGSRPHVIANLLKRKLVDFVAMDVKSGIEGYRYLGPGNLNISEITRSIGLIIDLAPSHEFRTTCVRPFVTPSTMDEILDMIQGASSYVLQHFSPNAEILDPDFFKNNSQGYLQKSSQEYLKNSSQGYLKNTSQGYLKNSFQGYPRDHGSIQLCIEEEIDIFQGMARQRGVPCTVR
ncbi:MAG: anaerobic ribonucleoside-triphosphate reductase activating protein [Desulfamplus sp.]|nr:anaerobic ribonucleoside-triphosphate reductase activating protein [Desulfamplus sp.]